MVKAARKSRPKHAAPHVPDSRHAVLPSDAVGRIGVYEVGASVEGRLGWIFREQPIADCGIDAHIEVRADGRPTGELIALQIKTGASYLGELRGGAYVYRGTQEHLDYWLRHRLPVLVVLHDIAARRSYWQLVSNETVRRTGRGWVLMVPLTQCFEEADSQQVDQLRSIAQLPPSTMSIAHLDPPSLREGDNWSDLVVAEHYEEAIPLLRQAIALDDADASTWEALAWCQYNVFAYPEALYSVNRALALDAESRDSRNIRACIFAEQGFQSGDRRLVEKANADFEQWSIGSEHWFDHYNFANTLRELGRVEQAESEYLRALELNPRSPEAWTNLGTLYRSLHRHDEEGECFDRALETDGDHGHALLNKGIFLVRHSQAAAEGAALIDRALRENSAIASRDTTAWQWLIEAKRRAGLLDEAIDALRRALIQHPTNQSIGSIGVRSFADVWRADASRLSEAVEYFRGHLTAHPLDYRARVALVRALDAAGAHDEAWLVLVEGLTVLEITTSTTAADVESIRALGCSLDDCIESLKYLPQYRLYRRGVPASSLPSDTLIGPVGLSPTRRLDIDRTILVAGAVVFGLTFAQSHDIDAGDDPVAGIVRLYDSVRPAFVALFLEAAKYLADDLDRKRHNVSEMSATIVDVVALMGYGALIEFSRQTGWILGVVGIGEDAVFEALDQFDEAELVSHVGTEAVVQLDQQLGLFPMSAIGDSGSDLEDTAEDDLLEYTPELAYVVDFDEHQLEAAVRAFQDTQATEAADVTQLLSAEELNFDQWFEAARTALKNTVIASFAIARGGINAMTDTDMQVLAAFLAPLTDLLRSVGLDVMRDNLSGEVASRRVADIINAGSRAYQLGVISRPGTGIRYTRDKGGTWTVSFTEE